MEVVIFHTLELPERSTMLRPAAVVECVGGRPRLPAQRRSLGARDPRPDRRRCCRRGACGPRPHPGRHRVLRHRAGLPDLARVGARRVVLVVDAVHVFVLHGFAQDQLAALLGVAALDAKDIVHHDGETMSVRSTLPRTNSHTTCSRTCSLTRRPTSPRTTRTSSLSTRRRSFFGRRRRAMSLCICAHRHHIRLCQLRRPVACLP